ncbi:MAG TPA: hypothetical protein VN026_15210 [Bacteroidia bacterium]|jgi:hypothetical protein|nr:hypothetical protein [Bacteroidia bacterium]
MKAKKLELDVDFIGGQGPLTAEEEKALSEYFRRKKSAKKSTLVKRSSKSSKLHKETA